MSEIFQIHQRISITYLKSIFLDLFLVFSLRFLQKDSLNCRLFQLSEGITLFFSAPVHILLISVTQMSKLQFWLLFFITLIGGNMLRNRNGSWITQTHLICQIRFRHTFIFWQSHKWAEKKAILHQLWQYCNERQSKNVFICKAHQLEVGWSAPCSHPKPTGMFSAHGL